MESPGWGPFKVYIFLEPAKDSDFDTSRTRLMGPNKPFLGNPDIQTTFGN